LFATPRKFNEPRLEKSEHPFIVTISYHKKTLLSSKKRPFLKKVLNLLCKTAVKSEFHTRPAQSTIQSAINSFPLHFGVTLEVMLPFNLNTYNTAS